MDVAVAEAPTTPGRTPVQQAQMVLLAALGCLFVVLLVSGMVLAFRYRPSFLHSSQGLARPVHRVASWLFILSALAVLGLSIAATVERRVRKGLPPWIPGAGLLFGAAGAAYSGLLLRWDQLALWAVTVGTDFHGYGFLFNDTRVKFTLIDGSEVGVGTLRAWFLVHVVAVPVLAAAAASIVLWRHRKA
jgi:quinol-cytochrome oxidoreductase complex cytochrome b subunit